MPKELQTASGAGWVEGQANKMVDNKGCCSLLPGESKYCVILSPNFELVIVL